MLSLGDVCNRNPPITRVFKLKNNTRTPMHYELRMFLFSVILTRWFIAQHDYPINHININLLEGQYMISIELMPGYHVKWYNPINDIIPM